MGIYISVTNEEGELLARYRIRGAGNEVYALTRPGEIIALQAINLEDFVCDVRILARHTRERKVTGKGIYNASDKVRGKYLEGKER